MKMRQNVVASLTSLDVRHLTQFINEVRRCRPVKAFVHKDGTLESNPHCSLQPVELAKERSDVVVTREEKMSRAAAFITDWSRDRRCDGIPDLRPELHYRTPAGRERETTPIYTRPKRKQ